MSTLSLDISKLLQGENPFISKVEHVVILLFQVNCPGCFTHGLPAFLALRKRVNPAEIGFMAIATAFEDFDLNTEDSANALVNEGLLVGATAIRLGKKKIDPHSLFDGVCVATDRIITRGPSAEEELDRLAELQPSLLKKAPREQLLHIVNEDLRQRPWTSATFESLNAQGTPTFALIHRETKRIIVSGIGSLGLQKLETTLEQLQALSGVKTSKQPA